METQPMKPYGMMTEKSSKREVQSNKGLHQEKRQITNQVILYLKELEKRAAGRLKLVRVPLSTTR